jgi:DNA-binding GntR family transcriptional regulator
MSRASDPLDDHSGELAPTNRRSLSDDVADRLRSAIVLGNFEPGQHLSEAALAEKLGTSRGPIREALAALEREGLLTIERHRGARVMRLSQIDIDEIYELRHALERLAVERALRSATDDDFVAMETIVAELRAAVKARDVRAVVTLDVRFHDAIYRAANHARLYQAWSTLRPQIETFLHSRSLDTRDYLKKAVREHAELLDVIRSRSKRNAIAMIDDHLRSAYERLSQLSS